MGAGEHYVSLSTPEVCNKSHQAHNREAAQWRVVDWNVWECNGLADGLHFVALSLGELHCVEPHCGVRDSDEDGSQSQESSQSQMQSQSQDSSQSQSQSQAMPLGQGTPRRCRCPLTMGGQILKDGLLSSIFVIIR